MEPLALRYKDAAYLLSVSESTVARMVRTGKLPAVLVVGSRRIKRVDVERYLNQLPTTTEGA